MWNTDMFTSRGKINILCKTLNLTKHTLLQLYAVCPDSFFASMLFIYCTTLRSQQLGCRAAGRIFRSSAC